MQNAKATPAPPAAGHPRPRIRPLRPDRARDAPERIDGVVIGTFVGFDEAGAPLVDFEPNPAGTPLPARAATALTAQDAGREVALLFERGDPRRPVVMGRMWQPEEHAAPPPALRADADGECVVLSADRELVLRCGKASLTLTRAGKILIRGAYLLSRSSGVNRIKGGSVQIN